MRIVLFLLLSLALHATALSYPVFFPLPRSAELLPVIILGPGDGSEGEADGGASNDKSAPEQNRQKLKGHLSRDAQITGPALNQPQVRADDVLKAVRQADRERVDTNLIETPSPNEGIATAANEMGSAAWETGSAGSAAFASLAGDGDNGSHEGIGGTGGSGLGKGKGIGNGITTGKRIGVTYAYSPKPEYPDNARKQGREGTVILRVLVDEEGRSQSIEVNRSSGFEALDQAALNAVRHWHFNAARYGDVRVESWVKIPIVFRLADSKD